MRALIAFFAALCFSQPSLSGVMDANTDACFQQAGAYHGIDPSWLKAIAKVESGFNPKAIGARNKNGTFDVGMMQINSGWFATLARYDIKPGHLVNACTNIFVGAWILAANVRVYGKTWQAIGAYNTGNPSKLKKRSAEYAALVRRAWESLHKPTVEHMAALSK